jgi:hypothetical protein
MMQLLLSYPYQNVRPSFDFAPSGASLTQRMEGWEDMPSRDDRNPGGAVRGFA